MATYTEKLNLKKPAPEEFYNIEDFNDNFQKIDDFARDIDENLSATKIAQGSYVGTGEAGMTTPTSLTFDFPPKFIFIFNDLWSGGRMILARGITESAPTYTDTYDNPAYRMWAPYYTQNIVTWSENSVEWYGVDPSSYIQMNEQNHTYHYIAIG